MFHDVLLIGVSFIVGAIASAFLYRDEAQVYERLLGALDEGEKEFAAEVSKVKSELAKIL